MKNREKYSEKSREYADRAVQFSPFAALKGYEERIAERTRPREEKRELSEEEIGRLSAGLQRLSRGTPVRVVYYRTDRYVTVEGTVSETDPIRQILKVGKTAIPFEDIRQIKR